MLKNLLNLEANLNEKLIKRETVSIPSFTTRCVILVKRVFTWDEDPKDLVNGFFSHGKDHNS